MLRQRWRWLLAVVEMASEVIGGKACHVPAGKAVHPCRRSEFPMAAVRGGV
jgi:hypothetical protein